jgi:trimethylamine:corrinoid methyltransferase-like protein
LKQYRWEYVFEGQNKNQQINIKVENQMYQPFTTHPTQYGEDGKKVDVSSLKEKINQAYILVYWKDNREDKEEKITLTVQP